MVPKSKEKGFTLVETLLVVILISILAAIIIPRFTIGSRRARIQSCEMNRSIINTSVEVYYFTEATWPVDSLNDIKTNINYFPDGIPTCPVDSTSYELVTSVIFTAATHRIFGHREGAGTHAF